MELVPYFPALSVYPQNMTHKTLYNSGCKFKAVHQQSFAQNLVSVSRNTQTKNTTLTEEF